MRRGREEEKKGRGKVASWFLGDGRPCDRGLDTRDNIKVAV